MAVPQTIHQPLHPSIRPKLDPEYVAFHDQFLQYIEPSDKQPWDPASRLKPSPLAKTQQFCVEVAKVEDRDIDQFQVRIFTPEGEKPEHGWPCLLWYHGGGWVIGGLASENGFLRYICKYLNCVVVSANYRHAPEHVYPAAIDDCYSALQWLTEPATISELGIDSSRLAIGGLSAGGQLATSTLLKSIDAALSIRPTFLLLICPVIDSTATAETVWSTSQHSPWLSPARMTWYRKMYFTKPEQAAEWTASPNYAPKELLAQLPSTYMAIAGCDLLAPEEESFAETMVEAGVSVEKRRYEGGTHSVLMLAGAHKMGKQLVYDACTALAKALGSTYEADKTPVLPMAS